MRGTRVKFADMESDYLMCRAVGHSWDEFAPIDMRRPSFGWRMSLRCTRCTAERHDLIGIHGDVVQRSYIYPDGYQLAGRPGSAGRMPASKAEVRRELYLRRRSEQRVKKAQQRRLKAV